MPNVMIWDMQIDRGATTLSLWTRSRGAYVWALPTKRLVKLDQTISFAPIADHVWEDADFDVSASASSGLPVTFAANGCVHGHVGHRAHHRCGLVHGHGLAAG